MKPFRFIAILGGCMLAVYTPKARASDLVTYQGKLTDAASAPLPNGQYWLGARIWETAIGGTIPLWSRKYRVPVTDGLFSLMLGATGSPWETPPPLTASLKLALAGTNRFVEITVMSEADQAEKPEAEWQILAPRQALGSAAYAMNGVPVGTVVPFAGTAAPDGWLLCDGLNFYDGADPRYASLYSVISATYGAGTGSQFKVPDLRGRVPAGRDNMGGTVAGRLTATGTGNPNINGNNLGASGGLDRIPLQPGQLAPHTHGPGTYSISGGFHGHTGFLRRATGTGGGAGLAFYSYTSANGEHPREGCGPLHIDGSTHTHPSSEWSGASAVNGPINGEAHPNTQPTIVLNYIIKL
jgi:microcystin-dependent protein